VTVTGRGSVFVRRSDEVVGEFRYTLEEVEWAGGEKHSTLVAIAFDPETAQRLWQEQTSLTLRLESGDLVDFFLSDYRPETNAAQLKVFGRRPGAPEDKPGPKE
jgi:hypothetical protein